jgi:hypothetical protein
MLISCVEPRSAKVETKDILTVTSSSITATGNVIDQGKGIETYGLMVAVDNSYTGNVNQITLNNPKDTGVYTCTINGLAPNTLYYLRAFAATSEETVYGNSISFTTLNNSPVVLLNTFGPNDSYSAGSGWSLGYDYSASWVQAIGFVPETSGTVSQYEIAVFRNRGGNLLNAWLLSSKNDYPDTQIEQFLFEVPTGEIDLILSANSSVHPLLIKGTRYWVVVAPPDITNEPFGWYHNPPINEVLNAQGHSPYGPWNVWAGDYAPTLRIRGISK